MTNERHHWTEKEEAICCYEYLKYSLQDIYIKDYQTIVDKLSSMLPEISKNSLKMKLQNIKHLCLENNIPDFIKISPLYNASNTNRDFLRAILILPEIEELINARKKDLENMSQPTQVLGLDDIRKEMQSFKNKSF